MSTVATSFGEIPLEKLVKHYEAEKKREQKKAEKRLEYLQTDEGKQWNRNRSKQYYEKHKAQVLAKRKAKYVSKKHPPNTMDFEKEIIIAFVNSPDSSDPPVPT